MRSVLQLILAVVVSLGAGCTADRPGRVFGARCDLADECGCFDPVEIDGDPDCLAPGTTEMACVRSRCTLPCEYGAAGDTFCMLHFRPTSQCDFEGTCGE